MNSINSSSQQLQFQPSGNSNYSMSEEEVKFVLGMVDKTIAQRKAELDERSHKENEIKLKVIGLIASVLVGLGTIGFVRGGQVKKLYQQEVNKLRGLDQAAPIQDFYKTINNFAGRISSGIGYDFFGLRKNWIEAKIVQTDKNDGLYQIATLTEEGHLLDPHFANNSPPSILSLSNHSFKTSQINGQHMSLKQAGGKFYLDPSGKVHFGALNRIISGWGDIFARLIFRSSRLEHDFNNQNITAWNRFALPEIYGHLSAAKQNKGGSRGTTISETIATVFEP